MRTLKLDQPGRVDDEPAGYRKWEKMIGRSVRHCKRADGRPVCALTSKDAVAFMQWRRGLYNYEKYCGMAGNGIMKR
jgi:hypothetical protein